MEVRVWVQLGRARLDKEAEDPIGSPRRFVAIGLRLMKSFEFACFAGGAAGEVDDLD